jgi:hypothetical protein
VFAGEFAAPEDPAEAFPAGGHVFYDRLRYHGFTGKPFGVAAPHRPNVPAGVSVGEAGVGTTRFRLRLGPSD